MVSDIFRKEKGKSKSFIQLIRIRSPLPLPRYLDFSEQLDIRSDLEWNHRSFSLYSYLESDLLFIYSTANIIKPRKNVKKLKREVKKNIYIYLYIFN